MDFLTGCCTKPKETIDSIQSMHLKSKIFIIYCWGSVVANMLDSDEERSNQPSWLGLENIPTASQQIGKNPTPNNCPVYDTKQSDGEAPVALEF